MKNIFYILIAAFSLLLHAKCVGQNNIVYGAGISYTNGVPTFVPPSKSARVAIDTATSKWYEYATPGGWRWSGDRVQDISGCAAPAYTPGLGQSNIVINNCTLLQNGQGPELYYYTGSAWIFINEKTDAPTYTAGTGIDITGDVITNTGDLSSTNEFQTLSSGTNTVTLSNSGGTVTVDTDPSNDITTIIAGTGIGVSGSGNSRTVTNTAPDQVVTISGATGTYPSFTIPTPAVTLNDLTDVTLTSPTNTQVLQYNSATTQWVNATLGAITGSGTTGRVAYWDGIGSLSYSNNFAWSAANERLGIGITAPQTPIHVRGTGGSGGGRVWVRSETTNATSGAGFQMVNSAGRFASLQYTSPSYTTGEAFSIFTESDYPITFVTSGAAPSGGASPIIFSPGGYSNEAMRITGGKKVAIGTTSPSVGAAFQVNSTTGVMVPPNMTSTQRDAIASPPNGIIFNTTTGKFQGYASGAWVDFH